jgi:hypothetical protein
MDKPISPRRLAENEVLFRQKNRAIEKGFKNIKELAKADNQDGFIDDKDLRLQFFCECSDENCHKRIPLTRRQYDSIHKADDRFVVICGHEIPEVEHIIEKTDSYCIVQKKTKPPKASSKLNTTPISNVT